MRRLLVISNGRGEDYIASRVVERLALVAPHVRPSAFPLVGMGDQQAAVGADVVGPRRELPSSGFTMHSPGVLWRDLRAGLLDLTLAQAAFLRRQRPDAVFVVGDFYAQAHAALVPAPRRVLQTLVSAHHAGGGPSLLRYFMEGFRPPELALLRGADRVYARDPATAELLARKGVDAVHLGNPMMDGLREPPLMRSDGGTPVVALLPGSRGQAAPSVHTMLEALELVPPALGLVAWTGAEVPPRPTGWEADEGAPGVSAAWRKGETRVMWVKGRFPAVLAAADAVIGTAGTANEQAVGLGLPVVAFPVPPFYGHAYMRNQKRLLEGALLTTEPVPERIAAMLRLALDDEGLRERARRTGEQRMGGPGASDALAADIAVWLEGLPAAEGVAATGVGDQTATASSTGPAPG